MRVSGDWLDNDRTQTVLDLLTGAGHAAYAVGGCVRNAALGEAVTDVDIATSARPETVIALATSAGLRAVPTGLAHGTVTLIAGGEGFEVTTFRRDVATDGRHAEVAFSDRIEDDAARRDFTMNALYADAAGHVLDPLGGMDDLRARRLRFVGDPAQRIAEDYLRILRFFRFHAQYGDPDHGLDADGLAACAAGVDGLARLSAERVTSELRKLLSARDPAPSVAAMDHAGVLARVLPGADPRALAPLVHLEGARAPHWMRRLAVLGPSIDHLRLTKAETRSLTRLRDALGDMTAPAVLGYRLGAELGEDAVLARAAVLESPLPPDWQAEVTRGTNAHFPIRAADLPGLEGAALGQHLKALEARWIASDFSATRNDLLS
ncbi:CCA tRNA nucleotidyltransferase [Roseibaca sp. V10]|uniref:CCA tRNA nucleotidyltransferase n=1 Tax=Roseinatronobacter domitianus TaxID=2940293 RepID=A0ABT0M3Z5_9RHOB|nr:CCA tRNA nucleotidyltransferase [Roseibaca domitiana]MCL1629586.1 CCA tRNA nucleotidyltransferase [Roseibaca domitiana]